MNFKNILEETQSNISVTLTVEDLRGFAVEIANEVLAKANNLSTDDSELVTRAQAAEQLGVDVSTLWRWERDNYLTPQRYGRRCRYRKADVERIASAERKGGRNV